ncbi:MAG: hypothetical protein ABSA77_03265 [Thermoguttaceae bacterium]|jgi:hypothetical protein
MKDMFSMTIPEWLDHCIGTIQDIAPELAGENVYLVSRRMKYLAGFTAPALDLMFENDIAAAGKWNGRGAAVMTDGAGIYQRHFSAAAEAGLDTEKSDRFAKLAILKNLIHESAHLLRDGNYPGDLVVPDVLECRQAVDNIDERYSENPNSGPNAEIPWKMHDAPFLRVAAHLVARCRARGLTDVSLGDIAGGSNYGLSDGDQYYDTLKSELKYTPTERSIYLACFRFPPPTEFVTLWHDDVKKWWASIPGEPTPEQEAAALGALRLYQEPETPRYLHS